MLHKITDTTGSNYTSYTFHLKNLVEVIDTHTSIGLYLNRLGTVEYLVVKSNTAQHKDSKLSSLMKDWNTYLDKIEV